MRLTWTQATLALIGVMVVANMLIHPAFLGPEKDWLGDYLKLTLSYPGWEQVHSDLMAGVVEGLKVHAHIDGRLLQPDGTYRQLITHFHEPPLATLVPLLSVRIMRFLDPALVYLILAGATVGYTALVAASCGRDRLEKWLLAAIAAFAYPTLFMLDRGNMFAGITSALVLHAAVLSMRDRRPWLSAILLALAINLRPNLVLFLLPIVAFATPWRWRLVPATAGTTVAIFFVALAVDHTLYPAYTLAAFRHGLELYSAAYAVGNDGAVGGSSLFTPLKLWLGYGVASPLTLALGAIVGLWAVWLSYRQSDRAVILFLVCASLALGMSTFADYHLTIFLLPLMAALIDQRPMSLARVSVLAASAFVLAPKNEWFWQLSPDQMLSYQVWANPIAVLLASVIALWPGAERKAVAALAPSTSPV